MQLWLSATLGLALLGGIFFLFVPLAGLLFVYFTFTRDLPPPEAIAERSIPLSTKIYDRQGRLLYEVFDPQGGRRTWVPLAEIPPSLRQATIATEDANFYDNPGFNLRGILRATYQNLRGEEQPLQGGSSITQQLVKNVLISPEERGRLLLSRKIKEIILAWEITRRYSKDQILEWYLNQIFYGNVSYGIEAAAQSYYGKTAKELTLAEAAMLAGLPQAPALYSPLLNPERAKARQEVVLNLMARQGFITPQEVVAAKEEELRYAPLRFDIKAPHFVVHVRDLLEKRFGPELLYRGGLKVTTTLDLELQEGAERIIQAQVEKMRALRARNAALVALRPATGEILAMVGSADYFDPEIQGQINMALAERQPGSAFKPFTYITAFLKGYTPATMILDVRTSFPDGNNPPYVPENVDGKLRGPVSAREALASSINIPAVHAIRYAGVPNVIETAHRMGINGLTRKNWYGLSLTLGGGEVRLLDMAFAYAVFANNGLMAGAPLPPGERKAGFRGLEPVAILKVETTEGRVLEQFKGPATEQVIPPPHAYLITHILSDAQARLLLFSPHSPLFLSDRRPAAVKTGTTNDWRDTWTVGYTPDLVTGVWVGNADNTPMTRTLSVLTAAPIWKEFMELALEGKGPLPFPVPPGLVEATVCRPSGLLPNGHCPTKRELFVEGTVPTEVDGVHRVFRIDRTTGKLASAATPPGAVEERVFMLLPREAADWARERDLPQPPREYSPPPLGNAAITSPGAGAFIGGMVPVQGSAGGPGFQAYRLEYGEGLAPSGWIPVGSLEGRPVSNQRLGVWNTGGLGGLYTLRLQVLDQSGAVRESRIPLTVDNSPPTVRISYPYAGSTVTLDPKTESELGLQAEAQDNLGIDRVEFLVDGASIGFTGIAPYNRPWRFQAGSHTLHAVAYDQGGNATRSEPIEVKVRLKE